MCLLQGYAMFGGPGRKEKGCIQRKCTGNVRVYNNSSVLHPLLSQEKAMCTQPTNIANPPTSTPLTQESATKMDQQPYVLEPTGVSASQPTSLPSNTSLIPLDNPLSMHVYLEQQHRKVKPSAGDGNCLFRSYSFQIFGSKEEHIAVRTAAIQLKNLNQGAFKPYLTAINKTTMDQHIQHLQRPSVFGTHIEILVLSTLFCAAKFPCCSTGNIDGTA